MTQIEKGTILYHISREILKNFDDTRELYTTPDICQAMLHTSKKEEGTNDAESSKTDDRAYMYKLVVASPFKVLKIDKNQYPVKYGSLTEVKTKMFTFHGTGIMRQMKTEQYQAKDLYDKEDVVGLMGMPSSTDAVQAYTEAFCRWGTEGTDKVIGWRQPFDQNEVYFCKDSKVFTTPAPVLELKSVFEVSRSSPGEMNVNFVGKGETQGREGSMVVRILKSWHTDQMFAWTNHGADAEGETFEEEGQVFTADIDKDKLPPDNFECSVTKT